MDEWTCNQRCLIVDCWLDLIVDVRAPDVNFDLGLHGVIMFIFTRCYNVYIVFKSGNACKLCVWYQLYS